MANEELVPQQIKPVAERARLQESHLKVLALLVGLGSAIGGAVSFIATGMTINIIIAALFVACLLALPYTFWVTRNIDGQCTAYDLEISKVNRKIDAHNKFLEKAAQDAQELQLLKGQAAGWEETYRQQAAHVRELEEKIWQLEAQKAPPKPAGPGSAQE